jgi:hypothetical protein
VVKTTIDGEVPEITEVDLREMRPALEALAEIAPNILAEILASRKVKVGDVVQLDPDLVRNKSLAACFMVVEEVKDWGVQGYIRVPGETRDAFPRRAYYRADHTEFEIVGSTIWDEIT